MQPTSPHPTPPRYTSAWVQDFCPLFPGPSDCSLKKSPEKTWERGQTHFRILKESGGLSPELCEKGYRVEAPSWSQGCKSEHPGLGLCSNSPLQPSRT